ncbi:MAG: carboxypeptidase regulatory-like domain-containing protein [Candidatus Omnitrophica bacterium]|nr:carboxypeptidase regulatory-like domain-containing protein [Candidatus Omnitrophota bacterium]
MLRQRGGAGWGSVAMATAMMVTLMAPAGARASSGGSITGQVLFEGPPPPVKEIQFGAEKQCALGHQAPPTYEDLVVNGNGTLKGVLVYVTESVPGDFPAPAEPVVVDQRGCVFAPHVAVARVGQPVEFRNSDPVLHNVRGKSAQGQGFNVAQPVQGMKTAKTFKTPELGMLLRCDVHFWMTSYLHVLAQPFYALTQDDGAFTIQGLPAGTYTLEAWHEKLGTQTQTVTVADGQAAPATFTFTMPQGA